MDAAKAAPFVPIVFGSIAFWLGKKSVIGSMDHTHRWMVYLRHAEDKDLSYAVSKVVFTLHPSFVNHIRGTCTLTLVAAEGMLCCARAPHRRCDDYYEFGGDARSPLTVHQR